MTGRDFVDWNCLDERAHWKSINETSPGELSATENYIGLVDHGIFYFLLLLSYCSQERHSPTKLPQLLNCQTSDVSLQAFLNMRRTPYVTSRTSLSFLSTLCWLCCHSRATLLLSLLFYARNPFNALRCFSCAA